MTPEQIYLLTPQYTLIFIHKSILTNDFNFQSAWEVKNDQNKSLKINFSFRNKCNYSPSILKKTIREDDIW